MNTIIVSKDTFLSLPSSITTIIVAQKKRNQITSHTFLLIACALSVTFPVYAHASVFSTFANKFKTLFIEEAEAQEEPAPLTSQTMSIFKPTIVDGTTTDNEVDLNQEALQAVSGSLRVSTEDVDFPTTDTISVYEVKKGDTIQDVAKLFGVSVNTIMWANNLSSRTITKGDTLIILPITGIKHTVKQGDTLASIARKYGADKDDIASYNGLTEESKLASGDVVIVPDGEIAVTETPKKKTLASKTKKSKILDFYSYTTPSGFFTRPVIGGRKTQGIHGHNGIDIGATPGTPVLASATGKVIVAKTGGYNGGYGNMVIITHDNGVQTVYAHLRAVYVSSGQSVSQGEQIGEVGNTGRSTGPHLHFEVRGAKNPF